MAPDLDSTACAIAYAWYANNIQNTPAVSLVQTPRSDLHLRLENLYAFSLAGLDPASLLCISDIPHTKPTPFPSTNFALVDHNRLSAQFSSDNPDARVIAVIDHHADEGLYKDTANPRIITTGIGSCASLVSLYLAEKCPDKLPGELATLLLSAIVIDTSGMVPGGKAVDQDRQAAAFLATRCTLSFTPDPTISFTPQSTPALHDDPAIQALNGTLQTKKRSLDHLGTRDLLRRDYKEYALTPSWAPGREILVGLSSVPASLSSWFAREGEDKFAREAEGWMAERGLAALGILTTFRGPGKKGKIKHRREQLFVVRTDGEGEDGTVLAKRLFKGLERSEELGLKDVKWDELGVRKRAGLGSGVKVGVWKQKNAEATRKTTAPLVKKIVEGPEEIEHEGQKL